jgi:hypothetical protein
MSQLLGSGYHIGGPTGRCAATGKPLNVGEAFVATLSETTESDDLRRADYSVDAWDSGVRPEGMVGSWRGVVPAPDAKKAVIIDDEVVMDLFEQLAEQTEPKRIAFRFVLALMLIRKKKLVCEETRRAKAGEPSVLLVRRRSDPRPPEGPAYMEVIDPGLDEEAIEGIMEQFEAVLSGRGLSEPSAPAPPPPSESAAANEPVAGSTSDAPSGKPAKKPAAKRKKKPSSGEGTS